MKGYGESSAPPGGLVLLQLSSPGRAFQLSQLSNCTVVPWSQGGASGGGGVGEMDGLPGDESREVDGGLVL